MGEKQIFRENKTKTDKSLNNSLYFLYIYFISSPLSNAKASHSTLLFNFFSFSPEEGYYTVYTNMYVKQFV